MDLKQLSYFTAIVEEGSISAAAKKLHISQPPLSIQMKGLEKELGVLLFERGLRSITLTDAGKLMYQRAGAILDMAAVTKKEIDNLGSSLRGTLRIGMVSSSVTGSTARQLSAFGRQYPEVDFQIYEGNTFQMLEGLKTKQIDVALVRTPFPENGFICRTYNEEYIVAAGRPEILTEKMTPREIGSRPLILYRRWEEAARMAFKKQGISPRIVSVVDNAWTSLQLAKAGMGVAMLPESFVTNVADIQAVKVTDDLLKTRLALVKRDDRYISNMTKIFFENFEI